jgi:hypothetical protein
VAGGRNLLRTLRGKFGAGTSAATVEEKLSDAAAHAKTAPVVRPGAMQGTAANAGDDVGRAVAAARAGRGAASPLENANYSQRGINKQETFSEKGQEIYSALTGERVETVDDLAAAIRSGKVDPKMIEVNYVVRDEVLIENTRTAQALERAGIPRSEWKGVNRTGDPVHEAWCPDSWRGIS